MGVCAISIITYPTRLSGPSFKLRALRVVHPYMLPPLGNAPQVRFLSIQPFIRGYITESFGRSTIFQPNGKIDRLCPQILRQIGLVQHCSDALKEPAIERFSHAIMLRHIVCCEATLGTLLSKKSRNVAAGVLATAV